MPWKAQSLTELEPQTDNDFMLKDHLIPMRLRAPHVLAPVLVVGLLVSLGVGLIGSPAQAQTAERSRLTSSQAKARAKAKAIALARARANSRSKSKPRKPADEATSQENSFEVPEAPQTQSEAAAPDSRTESKAAETSENERKPKSLRTLGEGVIVYSGPGTRFRPLATLPAQAELSTASKTVRGNGGSFYKVLLKLSENEKKIGYIPTNALVRIYDEAISSEDLEKYGDVALVNRALQLSASLFPNEQRMFKAAYLHYLKPGFYVKGFAGQFLGIQDSASVAGLEAGNDALLFGPFSGLVTYGAGIFIPAQTGTIFSGSSSVNAMMEASFGLRYNFRGFASLTAAATQVAFFNANNSYVTSGALFSLEIGL